MIDSILFPVDFSPSCAAMVPFVQRAAAMFHASITMVNVCDPTSRDGFEMISRAPSDIAADRLRVARDRLKGFLHSEMPETDCSRLLLTGNAAERIAECAKDGRFDLVVMPTHGGRFRRMFLGSTTARVLGRADCPVLTTQHAETIASRPFEHRIWACALSLSDDSTRVLHQASEAAKAVGAKLLLIHVVDANPHRSEQQSAERDARERIEALKKSAGCHADVSVVIGRVEEALLAAAREAEADALIIGRNPRVASGGCMSGFSYVLTRDAPCPVISA